MKHLSKSIFLFIFFIALVSTSCITTQNTVTPQEESLEVIETPPKAIEPIDDTEYSRSVAGLQGKISYETFQQDKSDILRIIAELDVIMVNRDYQAWRDYLTPASVSYWSNKLNLQLLSRRLPGNEVILTDLSQYFRNLFIPSRQGKSITEIRYNSPTDVKAVQVDGNTDVIYYNFVKLDGRWLVSLPKL